MKYKHAFLLFTIILMASCSKLLEIEPKNSTTFKNGIQSEKDIESLTISANSTLRLLYSWAYSLGGPGGGNGSMLSYYTDSISVISKEYIDIPRFSQMPAVLWKPYYKAIHQANIPLRFLEQVDMPEERKNYYRGQAYFTKASAYLHLIRRFGDVILIKDDVLLNPLPKTPWPEIAGYAIELAEQAVALLPEYSDIKDAQGNGLINKSKACKGAANALLAELCAWKAGAKYLAQASDALYDEQELWEKAANACTAIIESGQYALAANPEEVVTKVLVGDSRESIYEIDFRRYREETEEQSIYLKGGVEGPGNSFLRADIGNVIMAIGSGWRSDHMKALFPPNDLRRYSYLYKLDSLSSPELLLLHDGFAMPNKYRLFKYSTSGPSMGKYLGINQNDVIWRLGGIYLLRAECYARLGKNAEAIADLNTIRARSEAKPYQSTEDNGDLRYTIFTEFAKKELLFEPRSYLLPLMRNGYIKRELGKYGNDKLSDQDLRDGAMFSAIDNAEFNNNPLLRQNTYWFKRFGF